MTRKKIKSKNEMVDSHLKDYLKSSYLERLIWLEKANFLWQTIKNKRWQKENA